MQLEPISLKDKLERIDDYWDPHIVGTYNENDVMVAKLKGDFVWHSHADTDDFFLVLSGVLVIETEAGRVTLKPGDLHIVPKGMSHCPKAEEEVHILLIEPKGTPNTGDPATASAKPSL